MIKKSRVRLIYACNTNRFYFLLTKKQVSSYARGTIMRIRLAVINCAMERSYSVHKHLSAFVSRSDDINIKYRET